MMCKYCAGFSIKLVREGEYRHQPSLAALLASVDEGCEGCKIIRNCLTRSDVGETMMRKEASELDERDTYVWFKGLRASKRTPHYMQEIRVLCLSWSISIPLITDEGLGCKKYCWASDADLNQGNAAAQYVRHGTVEVDPTSLNTYRKIKNWIRECDSSHPNCQLVARPCKLPSRVLRIPPIDSVDQPVALYATADGETGDYAALSYCCKFFNMSHSL